jgi:tetratricopeptide (TPR) repeat protein
MTITVVLLLAVGVYGWRRAGTVEPPTIEFAGIDPAVAQAIETARADVLESPHSGKNWGKLGMLFYAHQFHDEAVTCFRQAEKLDPSEPRWPYFQGNILKYTAPENAIAALRRAASLCAGQPDSAALAVAELLLAQDRVGEAKAALDGLLQTDPANGRARLDLARAAYFSGNHQKSLEQLRLAAQDKRVCQATHVMMAQVYERRGDLTAAQKEQRLAKEVPSDPIWPAPFDAEVKSLEGGEPAQLMRAGLLKNQGRLPEAIAVLEQTVRDHPNSARGWLLLGDSLLSTRNLSRAEQAVNRAARLGSNSVEIPLDRGVVRMLSGDTGKALEYFELALKRKPDYAPAYFYMGQCLRKKGDSAGALNAFEKALSCKPNLVEAHVFSAEILVDMRKYGQALEHLRYALRFGAGDGKAMTLLGQVVRRVQIAPGL